MSTSNGNQRRGQKRAAEEMGGGFSSQAAKIMKMMGYQEGQGLGRERQGIVEPILVTERKGRKGLGHENISVEAVGIPSYLEWNIDEKVEIEETIEWISKPNDGLIMPDLETLQSWLVIGKKKDKIDDETQFVNLEILKWVLTCKSALDHVSDNDLFKARSRSNPYEMIKKGIFMNRAAMKMANIDARLQFEITSPKTLNGENTLKEFDLLYFADICAGPGGFSEYILWRKKWEAKGFGFTLKGECDFKLHDFVSGPPETFEPHYGVKNDGDIYNPENCEAFIEYVIQNTDNLGVHFVMADGGFSVKGKENIQEILSRQLYLSQAFVALSILREEGHFICKLFDVFTPFSVGLVYLMRFCFHKVSLFKPITSRPANSERYLICKWRKSSIFPVLEHLKECHRQMWNWNCDKQDKDILELVPIPILQDDSDPFFQYIKDGNDKTGINQIQNLRKIVNYWADESLREDRQWQIKNDCLKCWGFDSNDYRQRDLNVNPEEKFRNLLEQTKCYFNEVEKTVDRDFTFSAKEKECRSPYNWRICAVENNKIKKHRGFFLSAGRNRIYRYDDVRRSWALNDERFHYQKFEISSDTLIYGEIVTEYFGIVPNQKKISTFHIIDGMVLGGKNICGLPLGERNEWCKVFAKALTKSHTVSELGAFRAKELIPLQSFQQMHQSLANIALSGAGKIERLVCPVKVLNNEDDEKSAVIQPSGILFLQDIKEPWLMVFSKSAQRMYYFDTRRNYKTFDCPAQASADFMLTMENRLFWEWNESDSANKVQVEDVFSYLHKIENEGVK